MAVSISFFLVYSQSKITKDRLHEHPVSIRAQVRYTRSHLNWASARRLGHAIERIQFTTPIKAQPRYWKNGRVRHNHPNAATINSTLDAIAQRAVVVHSDYIAAGAFPNDDDYIAAMLGAQEAQGPAATFFSHYDAYIGYLTDRGITRTTRLTHQKIIGVLKTFQDATGYKIDFESINKTFSAKFTAWCALHLPRRKRTQDTTQTANRYLKHLRLFLSHAHTEGWTTATAWRQVKPHIRQPDFPVTITTDEIQRIHALTAADFTQRYRQTAKNILLTRDWFLLGTQTAMRWSDWRTGKYRFIPLADGQHNLQFTQAKTDAPVEIPLSSLAITILERHNFDLPAPFSPAATLQHLTAIAQAAGITKHITTHTARRTFCTLQEAAGVPRGVIMRITGHRTERIYLRYTGITYKVNADLLRRANPTMFTTKTAG